MAQRPGKAELRPLMLRLPKDLHRRLVQGAKKEDALLNAEIVRRLEMSFDLEEGGDSPQCRKSTCAQPRSSGWSDHYRPARWWTTFERIQEMRGTITKRGKNSWQVKYDLPREDGKRRQRYATVTGSRKDAQRELTRLLGAVDGGTHVDPSQTTVAEYLPHGSTAPAKVSPKTLERYRELAERQIIPHLGALKLQKLRPEHVQRWHGTLLEAGLSPRTVTHAHRLLSRVLGYAVENGTLARNVAAIRRPPTVEQQEIEILTPDQITDVRAKLAGHTPARQSSS